VQLFFFGTENKTIQTVEILWTYRALCGAGEGWAYSVRNKYYIESRRRGMS